MLSSRRQHLLGNRRHHNAQQKKFRNPNLSRIELPDIRIEPRFMALLTSLRKVRELLCTTAMALERQPRLHGQGIIAFQLSNQMPFCLMRIVTMPRIHHTSVRPRLRMFSYMNLWMVEIHELSHIPRPLHGI
ncbi:hypothetical protein LIPSTDRAFT_311600 [Lipomyces starkeyi NRRL Y-11557]|uniref:Uncharacterized protein n=1 Tax=Lipomyces starkeyi NRRL Y-11557 TaxID=675824 RepID=A0A1E3Q329_LIPST|nr:hypothetical protein LIPSTDRAFT_311600 [Lipomyces starkeyi NRRL Y-11557]